MFQKVEIPVVPIVLAFVMGPIIESNLSLALTIHEGDLTNVLLRPITITILIIAFITAVYGLFSRSGDQANPDKTA